MPNDEQASEFKNGFWKGQVEASIKNIESIVTRIEKKVDEMDAKHADHTTKQIQKEEQYDSRITALESWVKTCDKAKENNFGAFKQFMFGILTSAVIAGVNFWILVWRHVIPIIK